MNILASSPASKTASPRHAPLSLGAFVAILAALMSLNALATDIMLPGFPDIAKSLDLASETQVQPVITLYLMGFGISQMFMGFLSDRYGRRPLLIGGLLVYGLAAIYTSIASDITSLLIARFIQGMGSAAPRVIATAAIRDCYEGRRMARVMSLTMTVFMAAPVLAPSIGQAILLATSWRWTFGFLGLFCTLLLVICAMSFPETLPPEKRRAINPSMIGSAVVSLARSRETVGYTLAAGTFFGAMFGYINSAQQIMVGIYDLGLWFPIVFAVMALAISASSFVNSLLVERFGMRLISHVAVVAYCILSFAMALLGLEGQLSFWVFAPLMTLIMLLVGLVFSNFNALAMESQGHIAGVASSFIGAVTVLLGAGIGYVIGYHFNGTILPLALGFGFCGLFSLLLVVWTEKGKLFVAKHQAPTR
ncbi:MAG: multidrug effflux MFS transporter [Nitratireductor sp.]|nr:multidrug effflux MFS transporter [Nitratireductor sp.]